jgi:alpha-1,3-rhamnosyl/mannosyltransferase
VLLDLRCLQGPSARRGIGSYARGLLAGLIQEGFDSRLRVLLDAGLPEPELPTGAFGVAGVRRRYHGRLAAFEDAAVLSTDLDRLRPRLYHAITLALPSRAPCPVVVTLHDLIPWAYGGSRMWGERIRFWSGRRLLRRAERVIAVSKATAEDAVRLARVSRRRLREVPEGIDEAFRPQPEAAVRVLRRWGLESGYLLYVGALDARKDPAALLAAWRAARAAGADVPLVLAGAAGAQAPAGMPGATRLGYLPRPELAELLSAAGCLIFPSRYEGFGLPVLEAMACGCPVVTYRNSSLVEVGEGAAVLVEDGDAAALGRAAASVLADPKRRRQLVRSGRKRAAAFTWRAAARSTMSVYEELLR